MASLINPQHDLYGSIVQPYITLTEYSNAPTAVDVSQLSPGKTAAANTEELRRAIARGSAFVDSYCNQSLVASTQTEEQNAIVRPGGSVKLKLRQFPICEIKSVGYQLDGTNQLLTSVDPSRGFVDLQTITLLSTSGLAMSSGRTRFSVTYVAGYAHTTQTVASAAGVSTLTVLSTVGMYPGYKLSITDDTNGFEQAIVLSVTATTVTFTAPLANAHAVGSSVSGVPEEVKQATILLTSALLKSRGSEAIVMQSIMAPPTQVQKGTKDSGAAIDTAKALLSSYRRVGL